MFKNFLAHHSFSEYDFSAKIFPTSSDRAFWDTFPNETCITDAEKEIGYAWPIIKATDFMEYKKSGNRKIMENIHFDRRNHLVLFALAELKENKGRFLPQIVNGLFTICEESFWGVSAHWVYRPEPGNIPTPAEPYIDLFAAETAEHLSMISFLLREPLLGYCPEIIDRIEYELEQRIKSPYLHRRDFGWMGYYKRCNNWNPWILSNALTVFLLSETSERILHRALRKMFDEIQHYYNALPNDGGCDEGPLYWSRAGACLFDFLYQLKQATGGALDLFDDEKIKLIAAYMKKVHIASDYFVNVADAHAVGQSEQMLMLFGFAKETGQSDLMNFSAAVYQEKKAVTFPLKPSLRTLHRLIYHAEFLKEISTYTVTYPLHSALEYLPDMQLAALRNGSLFLCAKGGFNNESHNHNDVGSFVFYDGATPVLIDVGISTYTRFTFSPEHRYQMIPWVRSPYHNLPIVNGIEQKFGDVFRADAFSAEEGKITISYADAYPSEAGIRSLTRELRLEEKAIQCIDRFEFTSKENRQITEALMSVLPVRIENGSAIIGESYRVSASHGALKTELIPFEDDRLQSDWRTEGVTRILFCAEQADRICLSIEKL